MKKGRETFHVNGVLLAMVIAFVSLPMNGLAYDFVMIPSYGLKAEEVISENLRNASIYPEKRQYTAEIDRLYPLSEDYLLYEYQAKEEFDIDIQTQGGRSLASPEQRRVEELFAYSFLINNVPPDYRLYEMQAWAWFNEEGDATPIVFTELYIDKDDRPMNEYHIVAPEKFHIEMDFVNKQNIHDGLFYTADILFPQIIGSNEQIFLTYERYGDEDQYSHAEGITLTIRKGENMTERAVHLLDDLHSEKSENPE